MKRDEDADDIIDEARAAATLPAGARIRCAGDFGIRWGEIVAYDTKSDTYSVIDMEGNTHEGVDVDHIVDIL